jgi:hypothetical protein
MRKPSRMNDRVDPRVQAMSSQPSHVWHLLARTGIGLIALLLGSIVIFSIAGPATLTGSLPLAVLQYYAFAWAGAVLLAFAASQLLGVFYVGGNQRLDLRAWSRMSPGERGRWSRRSDASARWVGWLFVALVVGLTLLLDVRFSRVLWRAGLLAPGTLLMLAANLAALGLVIFWRMRGTQDAPSSAQWLEPGRWLIEVRMDPLQEVKAMLLLGIIAALLGGAKVLLAEEPADTVFPGLVAVAGAALLLGAFFSFLSGRKRQPEVLRLEIARPPDDPFALDVEAKVPRGRGGRFATRGWHARLTGQAVAGRTLKVWFDTTAPAQAAAGTGRLAFRLRVELPRDLPSGQSLWTLRPERQRRIVYEVRMPDEILFPHEEPGGG